MLSETRDAVTTTWSTSTVGAPVIQGAGVTGTRIALSPVSGARVLP